MIEMHSKYNNMHQNGMFYALIYINNHIIACINCVLSTTSQALNKDLTSGVTRRFVFTCDEPKSSVGWTRL